MAGSLLAYVFVGIEVVFDWSDEFAQQHFVALIAPYLLLAAVWMIN